MMNYARIEPQVLQIELHPYLTQEPLLKYAKTNGLAVTGYSSLGPSSYYELGMGTGVPSLLEHDKISQIASSKGKCAYPPPKNIF
jgi:D-xylose reductase